MEDALEIAVARGFDRFTLKNSISVTQDFSAGYVFIGSSPFYVITCDASADLTGCAFINLTVNGEVDGVNTFRDCELLTVTGMSGYMSDCAISVSITLIGNLLMSGCFSNAKGHDFITIYGNPGCTIQMRKYSGSVAIEGVVDGDHTISTEDGRLIIGNTCIGGEIHLRGQPYDIENNSGPLCEVLDQIESKKIREMPQDVAVEILGTEEFP